MHYFISIETVFPHFYIWRIFFIGKTLKKVFCFVFFAFFFCVLSPKHEPEHVNIHFWSFFFWGKFPLLSPHWLEFVFLPLILMHFWSVSSNRIKSHSIFEKTVILGRMIEFSLEKSHSNARHEHSTVHWNNFNAFCLFSRLKVFKILGHLHIEQKRPFSKSWNNNRITHNNSNNFFFFFSFEFLFVKDRKNLHRKQDEITKKKCTKASEIPRWMTLK